MIVYSDQSEHFGIVAGFDHHLERVHRRIYLVFYHHVVFLNIKMKYGYRNSKDELILPSQLTDENKLIVMINVTSSFLLLPSSDCVFAFARRNSSSFRSRL